ncbi:MAG: Rieske (2Fe-2S) protein [Bryobacteraceae bacterium]
MPLYPIGEITAFPIGEVREIHVGGEPYAICNVGGELHAVSGVCPHNGGPLGQGALHGTMLVCPWHAWEFDCVTGRHDYNPAVAIPTVPVIVDGGSVSVDLP